MVRTAESITQQGLERLKTFDLSLLSLIPSLSKLNDGALEDVYNVNGCANYQWASCLVDILKPPQVVELGGAMGVWDLMVLHTLPKTSHLYSITLPEQGLEYSYIDKEYKNFHPVLGDDLDLSNWPKDLDLSKTDLWYFDSLHLEAQLRKELDLYSPFFKKGAMVLFDDIHLNDGMQRVWDEIVAGKWGITDTYDATDPLHFTGYGCTLV